MAPTALVLMMAILALLLVIGVRARRDFPEVQGMRDASTLKEFDHTTTKGIHTKIFNNALEQFQAQTHIVPNEDIKTEIAKAIKVYQARTHPQEAKDVKMDFTPKIPTTDDKGVTTTQCSTNNNSTPPEASPPPPPTLPIPSTGKKSCPCQDGSKGTSISVDSYDICFCPKNGGEMGAPQGCSSTDARVGTLGNYKVLGLAQTQPHN